MGQDEGSDSDCTVDPGATEPAIPLDVVPLHSTNLLTVLDETGTIHFESPSIERIFGFEPADLVGDPVTEYFHPEDRDEVIETFEAIVESDDTRVASVEYRHQRADGSYCWVESITSSDPTPGGYYVVNTRDISTQKEREQELEEINEQLEQFASLVSHDLRNPLAIAQGRVELAQETGDISHLEPVAQAHERMQALVDDLLLLAQTGDAVGELEWVNPETVAEACLQTVDTNDISVDIDIRGELKADRLRFQQLLENLIHNAVEHGENAATVTIGELPDENGFYVADDGVGIDNDLADRIFESGYSTRDDGTGIGLAIVRDIAEAHGWEIDITDGPDGGARFEVTGVDFEPS